MNPRRSRRLLGAAGVAAMLIIVAKAVLFPDSWRIQVADRGAGCTIDRGATAADVSRA